MNRNRFDDISNALIYRAEDECAEHDPELMSSAGMVLVGDVYALLVCHGDEASPAPKRDTRQSDDELSPFIR
jgi:hypothetical protein